MYAWIRNLTTSRRTRDAEAEVARANQAVQAWHVRYRARERDMIAAERDARTRLIDALVTDYYHADALANLHGRINEHQIGIATGATQALAHVLGKDLLVVQHSLYTGKPVTATNWVAVNRAPAWAAPRMVLVHDGIEERVEARLYALREQALIKRGHPLGPVYREHARPVAVTV